jgi:undecaprenyl-diphosphatase
MLALNSHLFLLINASATASPIKVMLAEIIASELIYSIPLVLLALWIWGEADKRAGLASTTIASALAFGANQLVGLLWYEPRPFMIGIGHTLMAHAPDNSFPSDHTTTILAAGIGLIATRAAPTWGMLLSASAVLVAWSRIYLGLHFPIDMLASALIAFLFGGVAVLLVLPVNRWFMPVAGRLYAGTLDALHVPSSIFPRR